MHYNCLIVDDEVELSRLTCEYLQAFEISCTYVETAKACEDFLIENTIDVMLLDINLGENSGYELCKKVREGSNVPIVFISARQSDDDVLIALTIGGDDYLKKPFSLSILLAKVKVILKRMKFASEEKEIQYGQIRINKAAKKVYIENREVSLKAKEFELFEYLFENRNKIVSKKSIFENVWKNEFYSDGTLNVHIRKLREKLEEDANEPTMIKTIWGTGYIFEL